MKVLFINSVCGIRSTGRIVTDLAEKYMAEGHEVKIAYGRENIPEKYQGISYRIGTNFNVYTNALKARLLDNECFNAFRQTNRFIKWADTYNPDVLWLHNLHGYYLNIEQLFQWIKSRPHMLVRWTLHDCWAFTGHCAHYSMVQCEKWKMQCRHCIQKREYPQSVFLDRCAKNYRRKREAFCGVKSMTLITPSYWLAEQVKQSFLKNYPIEVVHNTIDTEIFKPIPSNFRTQYGLENKKIVLGVCSAWNDKKGFSDFIKLAEILNEPYKIVMVGLDKKQLRKIPPSMLGIERTNSKLQLAEIYTAADVFVNLTYEDTYPTVNLEALSCGIPCFTYRTGGSVETVSSEHVVEQGDLFAMAEKIRNIGIKGEQ